MSDQDSARPTPPMAARMVSLYESAAAELLRGRADLARAAIEELLRAAPRIAEVQELARQAAVVGHDWPARREPVVPAKRAPPAQDAIDLVAFHVDRALAPSGVHAPADYMAVLALSFESARLRAPRARRILLTDERTPVPASLPVDAVMRFALDTEVPMFERMRVQGLYLRGRDPARVSVLMDSDLVVNADPARAFSEAFDVGLTWRPDFAGAPFNGGMICIAEGEGGHAFLGKALACYEALAADAALARLSPTSLKAWWGDQFALATLIGHRAFAERTGDTLAIDGLRVRFLACDDYNFTIEPEQNYALEELRRKLFIHFKGNRKQFLSQYLERMRRGLL